MAMRMLGPVPTGSRWCQRCLGPNTKSPGRAADQEGLDVVGEHDRLRPRRLALLGDQVRQPALERADLEQRNARGRHVGLPDRRPSHRRAPSTACTSPPGKSSTMAMKSTPKIKRWKSTQRTVRYSFKNT